MSCSSTRFCQWLKWASDFVVFAVSKRLKFYTNSYILYLEFNIYSNREICLRWVLDCYKFSIIEIYRLCPPLEYTVERVTYGWRVRIQEPLFCSVSLRLLPVKDILLVIRRLSNHHSILPIPIILIIWITSFTSLYTT